MPPLGNMAGEIDSPANRARMQHQVGQIARQHQATTTGTTITGGTMDVWPQWNITYTTSANTSTATMITVQDNRQIWTAWNQGITSAVTYTTGITTATTNDWTIPNPLNTITWEVFNDRY